MPVIVEGVTSEQAGRTTAKWIQDETVKLAERVLVEEVARGFDPAPVVMVDGRKWRDYTQVRPYGRIEFARRASVVAAVTWALEELQRLSPVLTGRYRASHFIRINGQIVTGDTDAALQKVGPGDLVDVVNVQPYASKIEGRDAYTRWETGGGKRSRRAARRAKGWKAKAMQGQSKQAKAGVYRVIVRKLIARFGRVMMFDFKAVTLPMGVKVSGLAGGGSRRRIQRDQVYPSVQFRLKPDPGGL